MAYLVVGVNSGPLKAITDSEADDLLQQVASKVDTFKSDKSLKTDKKFITQISNKIS